MGGGLSNRLQVKKQKERLQERTETRRKTEKTQGQTFTSAVCQGEVLIVGDFRGQTEGEVLSVIHLVFVQSTHGFDDLYHES